ncbi:MAG: pentapeptide repeat-containing protein [Deltaproteobacteria bacterium]|nr:pentapeptide repeat-containing protein [Deltaproteobacteria bacterium]
MGCAILKKSSGWCENEPLVFTDSNGDMYCIFHAPPTKKGTSKDKFNKLVLTKVQEALRWNKSCDLSYTVFEWDIAFEKRLPNLNFSKAVFEGMVVSSEAIFEKSVSFVGAQFKGGSFFSTAEFREVAKFSGCIFEDVASFESVKFSKDTYFNGTKFSGDALFRNTKFGGDANFIKAEFAAANKAGLSGMADFMGAEFSGIANFKLSVFNKLISGVSSDAGERYHDLSHTIFCKKVFFELVSFYEVVSFYRAKFDENGYFKGGSFEDYGVKYSVVQETPVFFERADFHEIDIRKVLLFEGVGLGKVSFVGTDIRNINFGAACKWLSENSGLFGRRWLLYDELALCEKVKNIKEADCKAVELLYQQLKQKAAADHDWVKVSEWHYGEKEMRRKRPRKFWSVDFSGILPLLYWLSSGYAERPVRAGAVLCGMIIAVVFLMWWTGFELAKDFSEKYANSNVVSQYFVNVFQYVTFDKTPIMKPKSLWGEAVVLFTRIFIPIQVGLFVLAIRNRYRR